MKKLLSISELSKFLNLVNPKTNKPLNHVLRYWEKEFRQIRPKKIKNRRYYSSEQVEIVKMVKFLLKDKGITISGVKNILKYNINKLDDYNLDSLKADYYKKNLKNKSKDLLEKIKRLKSYGKKNSFKS
jgi:DNA-binding transcriptional MerR regulator